MSRIQEAQEWLRYFLSINGGSVESRVAQEEGRKRGFGDSLLKRARNRIGAVSIRRSEKSPVTDWSMIAETDHVKEWLHKQFKENKGQVQSKLVKIEGQKRGYSLTAIKRAANALGVVKSRAKVFQGNSTWTLWDEVPNQKTICSDCGKRSIRPVGHLCGTDLGDDQYCQGILAEDLGWSGR